MGKNQRKFAAVAPALIIILTAALGIVGFQNCTQPVDTGGADANSILAQKMDFSYEASLDQVAYMSCPLLKGNFDTDAYFTFRAGAYRSGGLKLKDDFFDTYQKKTSDRMIELLTQSPANSHTALQVAIRQVGTLNSLVANGAPKANTDYQNMMMELGTSEMASWLVHNGWDEENKAISGNMTRYMRDGSGRGAHMEATLQFGAAESVMSDVRDNFLNPGRAILAMTFVEPSQGGSSDTDVRSPSTIYSLQNLQPTASPTPRPNSAVAFGTGLQLSFQQPPGAKGLIEKDSLGNSIVNGRQLVAYPSNILSAVTERNLYPNDTRRVGVWTCPTSLRLRIVRADDLTEGGCQRVPDPDPASLNTAAWAEFKIARNSLRVEDWYIDWAHKCIIPKKNGSSCYGELNYVQYDYLGWGGCDPNSTKESNSLKSPVCLAWASICYRTN